MGRSETLPSVFCNGRGTLNGEGAHRHHPQSYERRACPQSIALAFDAAAPEGEAVAAFLKLRGHLAGANAAEWLASLAHTLPPPGRGRYSPRLTFGKWKGRTVAQVAETEAGRCWLFWYYTEATRRDPVIIAAIRDELGLAA